MTTPSAAWSTVVEVVAKSAAVATIAGSAAEMAAKSTAVELAAKSTAVEVAAKSAAAVTVAAEDPPLSIASVQRARPFVVVCSQTRRRPAGVDRSPESHCSSIKSCRTASAVACCCWPGLSKATARIAVPTSCRAARPPTHGLRPVPSSVRA